MGIAMLSKLCFTLAEQPEVTQLGELPAEILVVILRFLPLDARLRAREVSRGWRALLNEPRFWTVLDFSPGSGVVARFSWALLLAAGERGRGHMHTLDLTGVQIQRGLSYEHVIQFVAMHGQSLRSVTAPEELLFSADSVARLCYSSPLCTLRCHVWCTAVEALPLLRCEAPCALLHIFKLYVGDFNNNPQAVLDLAVALPSHSGKINELAVSEAPLQTGAVADALMRGIAEARVSNVFFDNCGLAPASLSGLIRLLQDGCLERLDIRNHAALFEEGPELTAFCHALRTSRLLALKLKWCQLWRNRTATSELLAALVGHQTLGELSLHNNRVDNTDDAQLAAGEQLASLITHNTALEKLDIGWNNLVEASLGLIFEALPRSSTLKELVFYGETVTHEFARDMILPAVRANTSLQTLCFSHDDEAPPELTEVQTIVAARAQSPKLTF